MPTVLSVSRLVALLREVVEDNFVEVLVEGEISNFSAPASGHYYFSLKDEKAQVRGVMFRSQNRLLRFRPENGMKVICTGRMTLYPQRGELQLVAEALVPAGLGELQLAFEQLKARLAEEGLFAQERKRALPGFPGTVGVVTSRSGAAIHDMLHVLNRRGAGARVLLRAVKVQGEGAAQEIAEAIADLNCEGSADVLIVGRGGGSLEDLWAFNEEIVARAIHGSKIPVISAVGHEVDFTIADFVADLRAPTPSAAAEMVAKSRLELEGHLDHLVLRMAAQMKGRVGLLKERVGGLRSRLRSPRQSLELMRLRHADLDRRLQQAMAAAVVDRKRSLGSLCSRLHTLSPLQTLSRGYAIVFDAKNGRAVRDAEELNCGDRLDIRLHRGQVKALVTEE